MKVYAIEYPNGHYHQGDWQGNAHMDYNWTFSGVLYTTYEKAIERCNRDEGMTLSFTQVDAFSHRCWLAEWQSAIGDDAVRISELEILD